MHGDEWFQKSVVGQISFLKTTGQLLFFRCFVTVFLVSKYRYIKRVMVVKVLIFEPLVLSNHKLIKVCEMIIPNSAEKGRFPEELFMAVTLF